MTSSLPSRLSERLREIPDFPTPGILFKDITPVLADPALLREVIEAMAAPFRQSDVTHVVGVESRGFLFGVPIALALNAAFAPARKPGKLPWHTVSETYALEYRRDALELHADALSLRPEMGTTANVLVVDDVLATGGTASATCRLVERLGGTVAGISVLIELGFLNGRDVLGGRRVEAITTL